MLRKYLQLIDPAPENVFFARFQTVHPILGTLTIAGLTLPRSAGFIESDTVTEKLSVLLATGCGSLLPYVKCLLRAHN
jgi:hypothetical protein